MLTRIRGLPSSRNCRRPSHPLRQFRSHAEKVQDRAKDMIEYKAEDPWIRQKFEGELAKLGLTTLMPADAYSVDSYDWHPGKISL